MSSSLTPTTEELYDSLKLTDIAKSNQSTEPSPRKYVKVISQLNQQQIEDYVDVPLEIADSFTVNKNILPIPLKQPIQPAAVSSQGQRILINPKLKIKMLNLYISQAIIQEEDNIFNCTQLQK
ncbi:unnamed protein product (macronuclear) [Paramecium tetraurelia]|uniref:Uncharacterized protein n=1 Tax=Paramecium tetraurelia TaxID=5888 RepID=A0CSK2_PARTE|nr:uncharacterized protein GSPATT00010041001 [Paramecium tetraurelia]CAK73769.1 unnamed protein product [Paramecium tetraurelia]|eukprot:XP_001441166.1 hypothetical protein (macronuclear) [Paramecium tetraurelia strain d4-2]